MSASITPTSVTFAKSSPFAIICVPSKMSTSPLATRSRISTCAHLPLVVSTSMRATVACANRSATSRSTCWVPSPRIESTGVEHRGHWVAGSCWCWQ